MDVTQLAEFFRRSGYQAHVPAHSVWVSVGYGFFMRVPSYETRPPDAEELRALLRGPRVVGLRYSLSAGNPGQPGHIYFVRDRGYDISRLAPEERRKTRRGLENCQVRRISFAELQREGMPLNLETLSRQRRDDPTFSDPVLWAQFCRAGAQSKGAQAWGAFVGDRLATYTVIFRLGRVVSFVHTMSRTALMKKHTNPALTFTVTQTMLRDPEIEAVCYGPEGISSSDGLDKYKQRMGFEKEPVTFVVRLRPAFKRVLLNRGSRWAVSALARWCNENDLYRRVHKTLDVAASSEGEWQLCYSL